MYFLRMNSFNEQKFYISITIAILLLIVIYFIVKKVSYKARTEENKLKTLSISKKDVVGGATKDINIKSDFYISVTIKGKLHYLTVNKANNVLYLSPNVKKASPFELISENDTEENTLYALKTKGASYIYYEYPELFDTKYRIYSGQEEILNNTLLKMNFSPKYNRFSVKFDNGMYLCYDKKSLELYCSFHSNKFLKKMYIYIEPIQ